MKRFLKTSAIVIASAFILAQLIPRPEKNIRKHTSTSDISKAVNLPESVSKIFQKSCYDCHSNHTNYPWYASIQPLSLWLNHHIEEGKEELNFSEFASYEKQKQLKKIEEIEEVVSEGEMPVSSYTLIHRNASLSSSEKESIIAWVNATIKNIRTPGNVE